MTTSQAPPLPEADANVAKGPAVTTIRVLYADLHGIARGKDVPDSQFDRVADGGLTFCSAVMSTDLRHTPVTGGEAGYPDLVAVPDMATMVELPWEPGVACVLADLHPALGGPIPASPRGAVRRAVAACAELGYEAVVAPELEFFLLEPDPAAPGRHRRRLDRLSMVYTVGPQADPDGVVRGMTEALAQLGLEAFAFNHEFMNSQYEINVHHSDALTAADRAFRLKTAVKDVAAQHGLLATFMGKPFNDQGGSGTHLHVSLERDGANAFTDPAAASGCSPALEHFTAGVLAHAPALMAFLNPTINAYRRTVPDSLAPTQANWGWDNRTAFVRIPPERGHGTRVEIRVGDGACNPYLGIAAVLFAGRHGLEAKLRPPAASTGDTYHEEAGEAAALPVSLEQALDALEADEVLRAAMGEEIVQPFLAVKRFEVERHRGWVSDWETDEYLHHL